MEKGLNEIFTRFSCRNFEDKPVEKADVEVILKAAMQAPSAGNQQPWEFIVVDKPEILEKLSSASPYASPAKKAKCAIVVLGNNKICKYPENIDMDLSACTQNILLQAKNLGLGSVWLGIAPLEDRMKNIREIFNLGEEIRPFAIVPIGYPKRENKQPLRYDEKRVHYNSY